MKMLPDPEQDRYANHNCADYVAQGKTFTYNEIDRLKDMHFNQPPKETPDSDLPAQASVQTDTRNVDNTVQGKVGDSAAEFADDSDAAAMNSEGEDGSKLNQCVQKELPSFTSGGTQTDNGNTRGLATFGTQTDNKSNSLSTQTDYSNMKSSETQTSNPIMKSDETQTNNLMTDAPAQVVSQTKNPFKCPKCGKGLSTAYSLSRHHRKVHKETVMSQTEKKIREMQEKK